MGMVCHLWCTYCHTIFCRWCSPWFVWDRDLLLPQPWSADPEITRTAHGYSGLSAPQRSPGPAHIEIVSLRRFKKTQMSFHYKQKAEISCWIRFQSNQTSHYFKVQAIINDKNRKRFKVTPLRNAHTRTLGKKYGLHCTNTLHIARRLISSRQVGLQEEARGLWDVEKCWINRTDVQACWRNVTFMTSGLWFNINIHAS